MTLLNFSLDYLNSLVDEANKSLRQRQHRNIHTSFDDPCQRFINAIGVDSYIRPHRHSIDPKTETLIAISGRFALVTFSDSGEIHKVIEFGSEKFTSPRGIGVGVDLPPGTWHMIIAMETASVLLELKAGPFNPRAAKELASWAPEEQTAEAKAYLAKMKSKVDLVCRRGAG